MKKCGYNRKYRRKLWHDKRSRKILLNRTIEKSRAKRKDGTGYKISNNLPRKKSEVIWDRIIMPKNFSLVENTSETIECFDKINKKLRLNVGNSNTLSLDFSEVENLGIDAIMYLIAFMQNQTKRGNLKNIRGNYPKNDKAKSDMVRVALIRKY